MVEPGRGDEKYMPGQSSIIYPTMALSTKCHLYPERLIWIAEHQFALSYTPDPEDFRSLPAHVDPFLQKNIPVRYHGYFPGYEFGHLSPEKGKDGLRVHMAALEAMAGHGEPVITIHIGLNQKDPIDSGRAVENLSKLVARARELGITVCLENLRRGPTSHPDTVTNWAHKSGAMITFDIGHAAGCQSVQNGELTMLDFLGRVADRLLEAHVYQREVDRHYPPENMEFLGPIVERLLELGCHWWTIELIEYAEALTTRDLLRNYLHTLPLTGQ